MNQSPTPHVPFMVNVKEPAGLLPVPIEGPTAGAAPLIVVIKEAREIRSGGQIFDFTPGQIVIDRHLLQQLSAGQIRALEPNEMPFVKQFRVPFGIIAWYIPEHAT